jgi:hypothetical protein
MGEWMYRSTFSLTLALAGGEWSASRPGRFTPGERAPRTHWIGGWVDDMEKRKFLILPALELRPSVIQPVASRYTMLSWLLSNLTQCKTVFITVKSADI